MLHFILIKIGTFVVEQVHLVVLTIQVTWEVVLV